MYEIVRSKGSKNLLELRKKLKKEDCDYYVYLHVIKGEVVYVGMGTFQEIGYDSQQRCYENSGRNYRLETVDKVFIYGFYNDKKYATDIIETNVTLQYLSIGQCKFQNEIGNKRSDKTKIKIGKGCSGNNNGMFGKRAACARKVICVTTGEIFDCMRLAGEYYNVAWQSISSCCRNNRKSAGKLPNGTKLVWKYFEK